MTTKPMAKNAPAAATTDAIHLLTDDHKAVHTLFQTYQKLVAKHAIADDRQALAEQICMLLTVHAAIEEEIFYPAARSAGVEAGLLDEAEVEHASAKELIARIRGMAPDDDLYDAKVTVLGEYVHHHANEEQDEMFPQCRQSSMDLKSIGAELAARQHELMAEMSEGTRAVPRKQFTQPRSNTP